jgi:hypothetical protein
MVMKRGAVMALVLAGCGQSAFDERAGRAWSRSAGPPDGISSAAYGVALTTVDREQPGATVVVAGTGPSSLSTLSFDVGGELEMRGLEAADDFPDQPVIAGALDPVAGGNGVVAIADGAGSVLFYDARTGDLGPEFRVAVAAEACGAPPTLGTALGFALTGPESDVKPDLVAVAGDEIAVLADVDLDTVDGAPGCTHCRLPAGDGVALVTGTVDDDDGEDLAVLTGTGEQIVVYTAGQVGSHTGLDCGSPLVSLLPPGADARFAPPMAVGDLEDNDAPEIAVASPDHRVVYVFHDVGDQAEPVVLAIPAPADSVAFGTDMVFGDFDGDDIEELAVGDPEAHPEGVEGAGQVTLYRHDGEELKPEATLYDSEPGEGQHFGRSLDVAEFGLGGAEYRDLLVVGAEGEVFVYFRVIASADDPRN